VQFRVHFESSSFDELAENGLAVIDAVARMNQMWFLRNPQVDRDLRRQGVKYDPPPLSFRTLLHQICQAPILLKKKFGKCDSISAWETASLRLAGYDAHPSLINLDEGIWHVVVKINTPTGSYIHDPSAMLPRANGPATCNALGRDDICSC
jgi:hypothetical protein